MKIILHNISWFRFFKSFGLAAGFDKNAEVIKSMFYLGFGLLKLEQLLLMPQEVILSLEYLD